MPTWALFCAMDAKARILRDAARYLGIRGAPAGRALAVLEEAYPMAREAARPRSLIRRAPMRAREGVLIIGDALTIPSRDLCRLFAGAREGLALAVMILPSMLSRHSLCCSLSILSKLTITALKSKNM